ncbi:hypothetical protein GCM10007898_21010 [Dyella flagellata]|uniref:Glycosyl transferase family 1 domain-containing protein n=2 Tax=Dyella flagellata TaxID=1867833 RepID=A0ABQ5XBH5_9GAMM|nr:hypothetical protein GCM10007898_21010 [Dyella flagellata]
MGFPVFHCSNDAAGILDAAHRARADIIFPTVLPLGRRGPPRVGYIPDFQHRRLSHLFSARTIRKRDRLYAQIAKDADAIFIYSRAGAADATEFLGVPPDRLMALPFTPYVQPWWFEPSIEETIDRYAITSPYFLICNHFWTHKDHATALRAFASLVEQRKDQPIQLILTGDPIDHRAPDHYAKLIALTRDLGIDSRTRFLGLVPKPDQLALMRGCRAVIQPTLFEGGPGGGAVNLAIGLGVPAIVSDIPVNTEIDIDDVIFFRAGNAHSLTEKMIQVLDDAPPISTPSELLQISEQRLTTLGAGIVNHLKRLVT